MEAEWDERDAEILAQRINELSTAGGPHVGDFVRFAGVSVAPVRDLDAEREAVQS